MGLDVEVIRRRENSSGVFEDVLATARLQHVTEFPAFKVLTLCGPDIPDFIIGAVAHATSEGLTILTDRAVDAAITVLLPGGGAAVAQLIEVGTSFSVQKLC